MAGTNDAQKAFTGTRAVDPALRLDESRLTTWMQDNVEGFAGPMTVRQFRGGQSNPTYKLETASKSFVLRRKPPGRLLPSAHAVDREFRVISALCPLGFPVARPHGLCLDETVTGTAFYVMDFVEGRVLWNATLPGFAPCERRAIYDSMVATLARLHNTDWQKAGLAGFGRPNQYIARQIHRWTKQYLASQTDQIDDMDRLIEWLPGNVPPDDKTSIVHGDYRIDNLILHPDRPEVIAVLDWELSTLGDPLADFTYHLMNWVMPGVNPGSGTLCGIDDLDAHGIPGMQAYIDLYCEHAGRDDLPEPDYYFAYNAFRLAAICQGIAGRVRDGTASNAEAAQMQTRVRPLAAFAAEHARRAGMGKQD